MVFKDDYFKLLFCKFDSFYDYNFNIKCYYYLFFLLNEELNFFL